MLLAFLLFLQTAPDQTATWKERHHPDLPELPSCPQLDAPMTGSLAELPEGLRAELARFFGPDRGLADIDGVFNSTDVIDDETVPSRRFLRAYRRDDLWVIWYEHGGFVHHLQTIAARREHAESGAPRFAIVPGTSLSGNMCKATQALFDGVHTPGDM